MATNYSPKIVTDGLVLCLDAADKTSYSGSLQGGILATWTDLSGNGNHGSTVNNPTFDTGSSSIKFVSESIHRWDCSNDSSVNIQSSMTAEAWINLASTPIEAGSTVVTKGNVNGGASTIQYNLHFNTSRQVKWQISDGSSGNTMNTTAAVSTGIWTHIVGTHDAPNTNSYIYINGELSATDASSIGNLGGTSIDLTVGYDDYSNRYAFDGNISNVRIYNRALSDAEIKQNFNAQRSRFGV